MFQFLLLLYRSSLFLFSHDNESRLLPGFPQLSETIIAFVFQLFPDQCEGSLLPSTGLASDGILDLLHCPPSRLLHRPLEGNSGFIKINPSMGYFLIVVALYPGKSLNDGSFKGRLAAAVLIVIMNTQA